MELCLNNKTLYQGMRSLSFILLLSTVFNAVVYGQASIKPLSKPALSISDLGKWPYVENPKISNDGKYVMYTYRQADKLSLAIKSTEGAWEKWIDGTSSNNADFTENSQFIIVQIKDSLHIIQPSKNKVETIVHVSSYKMPEEGNGERFAY
jgi:hypothetical protein